MILRNPNRTRYTVLDNQFIEDERLSGAAVGLGTYLFSKPDGWIVRPKHLASIKTVDGRRRFGARDKIQGLLKELERAGYLEYRRIQGNDGRLQGTEIVLRELSSREPENTVLGQSENLKNRQSDSPSPGKSSPLVITDSQQILSIEKGASAPPADKPDGNTDVPGLDQEGWRRWVAYRKSVGLAAYVNNDMAQELAKLSVEKQQQCIQYSIAQGYKGLFPNTYGKQDGASTNVASMTDVDLVSKSQQLGISTQGKHRNQLVKEIQNRLAGETSLEQLWGLGQ